MTTGDTEETAACGQHQKAGRMIGGGRGGEGNKTLSRSFTTLSTVVIQAGQSQMVISVLRSGPLVHLQLVQVHPGLCEIGSNQEENQTLIQEQQQLMEKLKKHEREVLAAVENGRQTEQRRKRRDEGMMEQKRNKKNEEEEEVYKAMAASLSEGWSLLLRLLERRQEVLTLASDFYRRALEFAVSIDRVEDLQIRPDSDTLTEVQLTFDSMRRDLLGKSLQVLTSSSVLLQKLRQLQRTEALQRTGGVLQDEEGEGEESSPCSRGWALRLEELVESLQDQRRRADQAVRLQLQQAENGIMVRKKEPESIRVPSEDWTLTVDETLVQNLQSESTSAESTVLQSDSRTKETRDLQPGSSLDLKPESKIEETTKFESDLKPEWSLDVKPGSRSEQTRDVEPQFRSDETRNSKSQSRSDLQPGFRLDQKPGSRLEEIRNLQSRFSLNLKAGSDQKSDSKSVESRDCQSGSISVLMPGSRSNETKDLQPESTSHVKSESRSEKTINLQTGSRFDQLSGCISEQTTDGEAGFRSKETRNIKSGPGSDVKTDSRSDGKLRSTPEETKDLQSESRSEETMELQLESRSDIKHESRLQLKTGSISDETRDMQLGSSSDLQSDSTSEETTNFESGSTSDVRPRSRLDLKTESRSETKELLLHVQPRSRSEKTTDLVSESTLAESKDLQPGSRSKETGNLQPGSTSVKTRDLQSGTISVVKPGSGSEKTRNLQSSSRSDVQPRSRSDLNPNPTSEAEDVSLSKLSRKQEATAATTSVREAGLESMLGKGSQSEEDHAHQVLLTRQRQQLLSSCERLVDKVWSWVQQGSSVLCNSSEAGQQLFEAEDTLNTHLKLHSQAESAGRDAENLKQILVQIQALHKDPSGGTGPHPLGAPSRQLSPLKALTEQLKRGSTGRQTRTSAAQPGPPAAEPTGSQSPELADRVDLVLRELQSLDRKIDSNLQLLQPYVTFLRMAQQVEEEMEELRETCRRRAEEEEEKQEDACWQETLQRLLAAQELGHDCVHSVTTVSGSGLNVQSVVSAVQQTIEQLNRTKQEVKEQRSQRQIQIQQQEDMKYCRKYRERLFKTLQDLNCVSELLDSCTVLDLGSDLQTTRLLEHFSQARPHFIQLDAEVEFMVKSWETLRGIQDQLEAEEVKEEDLSELLKLQKKVGDKIQQSESILDLTSSFHLTAKQRLETQLHLLFISISQSTHKIRITIEDGNAMEALLLSDPVSSSPGSAGLRGPGSAGLRGPSEAELSQHREEQQQIQNLFKTASTLKTDICTAVTDSGWTGFRLEQLEVRLLSLDSLRVSWLNEAARREEKLRRELLTHLLYSDMNQVRDSFKELKKRFSNMKFNYLKRNDRTRNMKAVRNQLQQVELYEEKLQVLRKRLQGVKARLGSEVKDGGVTREVEDAVNELQRQMGEFGRSVSEHQKTLDMTCRLQQAMEEYQFWCEEASATIARVGKFSSECRSTEAVSVLYRQFEKFVWPTVPQQEERISQISELAVRLHGVEEGRRYIEKTVSKHSEMVESIRELSDGLMELEAKLKLESLKQQQNDGEKEIKEEGESGTEEKDEEKENKLKENRKMKKKEQVDNRSTQEAADMYELKETGHTPELTAEHDGKEVPVKRQTAANRKPPLQKSRSLETDRQTVISESRQQLYSERFTSSYCSTHTLSLSCSPVEANRRVHAIHSQLQPVATEPQATPRPPVTGPSFSDVQKEFQRKEMQEMGQQDASARGLSDAELQQEDMMTEDSLSNDEYDCASPDDISLPPLAETPESSMVQSDIEEGFCFSSHSVHISQYSQQYRAQSDHSGTDTGAVQQQKEPSQTEGCPTPPTSLHASTRFRSESSCPFVQSPSIVPALSVLTSTLCRTEETSTANIPQSADLCPGGPEPDFVPRFNPVHKSNTTDSGYNKDNNVPERRSSSKMDSILNDHNSQYNQSPSSTRTQGKSSPNATSKREILPQTDPISHTAEPNQSPTLPKSNYCPQPRNGSDCPQSFPVSEIGIDQDINSSQTRKEISTVSKPQRDCLTSTSTVSQKTIYLQSSPSNAYCTVPQARSSLSSSHEIPLCQSKTLSQINPVPGGFAQSPSLTDSAAHKDSTLPLDIGLLESCGTSLQTSTTTLPRDINLPQSYQDSRRTHDQDVPSSQACKETTSVNMPQSSSLTTTTTVTQQTVHCKSFPSDRRCNVPHGSSTKQESPFSLGLNQLDAHAPILPEPNNVSSISISSSILTSSNRFSSKQSDQTVYSLHGSLTPTCTQQCVHDPGMTPGSPTKPAAPPQPETQTPALAQQPNPHDTPPSSPPHLLTSDQDPDICQPMAIREEIRLTPQIQGPPLPAPSLPWAQAESLPQGKASKPGPPCFTRPLSRATVMEGSPVTLEVEVTGHPEPTLTWCKDGDVSATSPVLVCEDAKHFLSLPEASDSDGRLLEARAADLQDSQQTVFDIISADWHSWFGTLCVLLWLLYLIVL